MYDSERFLDTMRSMYKQKCLLMKGTAMLYERWHGLNISDKMLSELFNELPDELPETGGIIGGVNNEITEYWIDNISKEKCICKYAPNVDAINQQIKIWSENNIEFFGIFHTHYFGVRTLSEGDTIYMRKIMDTMPSRVEVLYFPVMVFPNKEMVLYGINNQTMEIMECNYRII